MSETNPLVGKIVTAVYLADDGGAIRFDVDGGDPVVARADGDCCSHTWIESVDSPERLIGVPVVSVEDLEMPDLGSPDEDDVIAYYGCKIVTEKGDVVIDYRNESNGYYGGDLSWPTDSYFYGGVYGQNVSTENWRLLAGQASNAPFDPSREGK